ncbi:HAD family hydrolase [Labilibacter marinus]|uniref:HAD family hydrolase n=1 Tax=Labilibacter marinus TaxID=1477105 RepID=UPI000832A189|nr:HAD family hydrolase [Labilibacter marinus]
MNKQFKYIGFDADDTLWENETFFRETEEVFCELISDFADRETAMKALYDTEITNLKDYGYGIKGFILSLLEAANELSKGKVSNGVIVKLIALGKELLNKPVVLIDGIEGVLKELTEKGYKLIVATKGDLLDQERKLRRSNLEKYFHHIEVMSDKQEDNYKKLLAHLEIEAKDFLMIGNSLKSDIFPVLKLGGSAVHIPFHTTWIHEHVEHSEELENFWELDKASELMIALGL